VVSTVKPTIPRLIIRTDHHVVVSADDGAVDERAGLISASPTGDRLNPGPSAPTNDRRDDDYRPDPDSHRDFLLAGAVWQDGLLQNYRLIFLTLHAILFAIGIGVLAASLSQQSDARAIVLSSILICIAFTSSYLLVTMRKIVLARGNDVNFWHRRLIRWENDFTVNERDFTRFKIHQKSKREDSLYDRFMNGRKIDEADIDDLIEKGLGHTRKIIDKQLFRGLLIGWFLLSLGGVLNILVAAGLRVTFKS
jgi:hypothetical protein